MSSNETTIEEAYSNEASENKGLSLAKLVSSPTGQRSLRIALLGYRSHPFVGGQGIYLKYLSRALASIGHKVDVISGPPYPELDDDIRLIKLPSLNLYEEKNHVTALRLRHCFSFTDFFEWWSMLTGGFGEPYTFGRRAFRYLKKHAQDYDLIHDNQCLAYGLLEIEKLGLPVVATIHHPIYRDKELALKEAPNKQHRWLVNRWYSFLNMQQKVANKLQHVITVSEASRIDIAKYFQRDSTRTQLIPNGVDTEQFRPLNNQESNHWQLISTASADQPIKGLSYLLHALEKLKREFPLLKLLVIGKLKTDGKTQKIIEQLKLEKSVTFVSGISTEELVKHYNQSTIAVCPSLYEGFGLPVIEAMSCQLPVVTTRGGALPEVIGDTGLLVEPGNSEELYQAIKTLLDDRALAQNLAQRARKRAEEKFCWNQVARQLTNYYQQMLD